MPQVISDKAVRQTAEQIAQENTVFREAFRQIDVPERTGDTFGIPVPDDVLGEPTEMQPGSEFDYGREDYSEAEVNRNYYGQGSRIPEQESDDATFSLVEDHVQRHAENMALHLDTEAYNVLDTAAPAANQVGSSDGTDMTFDDVSAGVEALEDREGGYMPDAVFLGTQAKNGLLRSLQDRGTDLGDNITQTGEIGNYAGLTLYYSNINALDNNDAILVDTDYLGYEGVWNDVDSDQEEDFDTRSLKIQIFAEMGWVATQPEAAVRVRG